MHATRSFSILALTGLLAAPHAAFGGASSPKSVATTVGVIPPGPPECTVTNSTFQNTDVVPLPDVAVTTSTIVVSGMGSYLWDVNAVTNLMHTFAADLDVTITSPAGTVVTLTTDNGAGNDDVFNGTVWDDQADPGSPVPYAVNPNIVTDHTFTNLVTATPLVPEEAMGAFIGENPNGTWTITISDDLAGDTGTLNGWSLEIATLPAAPLNSNLVTISNATPTPIADAAVATSTIDAPGSMGTRICRVVVTTQISHTFCADLDITLTSPSGTVVTLTTDNAAGNDDVFNGTTWDDKANPGGQVPYTSNDGLASDQTYANLVVATPLVPEEALAAFNGENPTGTWTLTVSDDLAGDTGTINAWSIDITTCSCAYTIPAEPLRVDEHAAAGTSSNLNGVFEAGETVQVEPTWQNTGTTPFQLTTNATNFIGPAGPTYVFPDTTAAYGTIGAGTASNCYEATGNCYQLHVAGARPAQHWDVSFDESAIPLDAPEGNADFMSWTIHVGESFPDVPIGNPFYRFIETIFHNGVTGGCAGGGYCPGNNVTRAQMAVFLLKAKYGSAHTPPPCTGTVFTDVPCTGGPFDPFIEELAGSNITGGCGGGAYCPGNPVTRAQMAVFLLKADLGSSHVPPACTGTVFTDVPCTGGPFDPWIEDLASRSITGGCGGGMYCPGSPNSRGQMAVFLTKTFGMLLDGQ